MPRSDKEFLFGAATSAYQVEGGNINDFSEGGLDAGKATDHYRLFEKDFDIAESLSQNAHRFSIEWSRIEPEEGKFNPKELEHYRQVLLALRKRELEPFVTLWHFTNPVWFARLGGWENKKAAFYFVRYARYVAENLKDLARFWVTINEPEIYARHSYVTGAWPPKIKNSWRRAFRVLKNLIGAHSEAYQIIKGLEPDSQIGISTNLVASSGAGAFFLNLPNFYTLHKIKKHHDFIGLNYYMRVPVRRGAKVSDMGWEIYPEGIYQALQSLKKYQKPIFITENGIADSADRYRGDFIQDHLKWIKKAIEEGIDARGYFYWSLLDNFEWHHGFGPRFGLVEIDYKSLERKIRPSAYGYAKIAAEGFIRI